MVCAEGPGKTKAELEAIADKVGKKLVQQLIYDRIMTELKARDFQVLDQRVEEGERIRYGSRVDIGEGDGQWKSMR